ncbi:MAG: hypothetical protein ACOX5R_06275 [bacterium]|jgi:hypothetical protein
MKSLKIPRITSLLIIMLVSASVNVTGSTEGILLRHHFSAGQHAQAITQVMLKGNSQFAEALAATDLKIRLHRTFTVQTVDSFGNATIRINLARMQTDGLMDGRAFNQKEDYRQKSEFNKDLTGEELERVMFGQTTMTVEVSPLGQVRGNQNTLTQMGISLPMDPGSGGGFELPSFPTQPVTVGDRWTENGTILNRYGGDTPQGQWVYQLSRISPSAKGRVAIIRYRKVTDLSRMNLGGMQGLSAGSLGSLGETPSPGRDAHPLAAIGGLVIELEGQIEFNIDYGIVLKTAQQGSWNLQMDSTHDSRQRKTRLEQKGMQMMVQTQMQWTGVQPPQKPQPSLQQPFRQNQPLLRPSQPQPPPPQLPEPEINLPANPELP